MKNFTRKRSNTKRNAGESKRTVAIVRSLLSTNLERKVSSVSGIGVAVATGGAVIPVTNSIVNGDDIFQRTGTIIKLTRIRALYRGTAVTTSSSVRFILFRDMLNLGAFPVPSSLLPSGTWISQYSDTRKLQQHRFKILHDITMDLNIAGQNVITKQFDIPVKGLVYYNGLTAVATAEGPGSVYLLVIGNAISTAYDYTIQTMYTDA